MTSRLPDLLQFTVDLAKEAGALITKERNEGKLSAGYKTPRDVVTKADLASEKLIVARILERYPEDRILAEESHTSIAREKSPGRLWVIDPIDGTTNYSRGDSHACVSIGVCEGQEVVVGVVYSPFEDELFSASRGQGAYCNGNTIKPSNVTELQSAIIIAGRPLELKDTPEYLEMLSMIINSCHDFRRLGSAALDICWVAAGRADGFFESLHEWDIAAACLIAKEAGVVRSHLRPIDKNFSLPEEIYPMDLLVAAPGIAEALHHKLAAILR